MILKDYIDAIEANANQTGGLTEELKDWLTWAKDKAERFNPINNQSYL